MRRADVAESGPEWTYDFGVFSWLLAEEVFLGAYGTMSRARRVILALAFRSIAWGYCGGAVLLHTGEVLMILLAMYFVLVTLLQRAGDGRSAA